jgi:hypothetical protein
MAVDDNALRANGQSSAQPESQSTAELVRHLAQQTAALTRQEARLAQLEFQQKARRAGVGVGMFGAAGTLGAFGLAALLSTSGAALALVLPVWAAILVVTGAVLGVSGMLAVAGRRSIKRAAPPPPAETMGSVREDVQRLKASAHR